MKTSTAASGSESLFYFFDAFSTHRSFFAIFVNGTKTKFLPVLLDVSKFAIMVSVFRDKLGFEHCGVYSYIAKLVEKSGLSMDCVNMMFSDKTGILLTNLVVRSKKSKKIDDISKLFIFPADGAMVAFLLKVPIDVDPASADRLVLPIAPGIDASLLVEFIKTSISLAEEKEDKGK